MDANQLANLIEQTVAHWQQAAPPPGAMLETVTRWHEQAEGLLGGSSATKATGLFAGVGGQAVKADNTGFARALYDIAAKIAEANRSSGGPDAKLKLLRVANRMWKQAKTQIPKGDGDWTSHAFNASVFLNDLIRRQDVRPESITMAARKFGLAQQRFEASQFGKSTKAVDLLAEAGEALAETGSPLSVGAVKATKTTRSTQVKSYPFALLLEAADALRPEAEEPYIPAHRRVKSEFQGPDAVKALGNWEREEALRLGRYVQRVADDIEQKRDLGIARRTLERTRREVWKLAEGSGIPELTTAAGNIGRAYLLPGRITADEVVRDLNMAARFLLHAASAKSAKAAKFGGSPEKMIAQLYRSVRESSGKMRFDQAPAVARRWRQMLDQIGAAQPGIRASSGYKQAQAFLRDVDIENNYDWQGWISGLLRNLEAVMDILKRTGRQ